MKFLVLKSEIARKGMAQKEVAKIAGMAECSFSLKLNGKREFHLDEMRAIRDAVAPGMTLDALFFSE